MKKKCKKHKNKKESNNRIIYSMTSLILQILLNLIIETDENGSSLSDASQINPVVIIISACS